MFGFSGSVVSLKAHEDVTGVALAHEMGHYLGEAVHIVSPTNFMSATLTADHTGIEAYQGKNMKKHCHVKEFCHG